MSQFLALVDTVTFLVRVVVVGFAAGYLLRAWQTGSLFAPWISNLENGILQEKAAELFGSRQRTNRLADKLQELLLCPLCLAPYICAVIWSLLLIRHAVEMPFAVWLSQLAWLLCVVFASAQVAYMLRRSD